MSNPVPSGGKDPGEQDVDDEVGDVATLMARLKRAAIDREKIVLINRFMDEGGEELYYLAEQVRLPLFTLPRSIH